MSIASFVALIQAVSAQPAPDSASQPPEMPPEAPGQAVPPPPAWLPQPGFELSVLDKVTARSGHVSGKVGETVRFGSLSVTVKSCLIRPPDKAADAAAWLDIVDSHPNQPDFHGWMIVSAPFVAMLQHPLYDVRLAGCQA